MIQQPYNSLHSIIYERLSLPSSHVLFLTGKPALPVTNTFKMSNSRYKMRLKEFMMQNYFQNFRGRVALGSHREAIQPDALKAGLAEFISVLIFVFAGEGSGMAFNRISETGAQTPASLIQAALAHGFGLFVAVSAAANISGGHCNPAVTFGAFLGGNITLFRGLLYWIAQLLGSVAACFLLKFCTHGMSTPVFVVSADVSVWNALVFEIVMTFGLVYTVYATAIDPNKGTVGTIAPIAIGFIVAANILAGGAFEGASMNPAVSFGPAVASLNFHNLWIYIVGPLIGGGLAGLIYEFIFIDRSHRTHEPLPTVADY